MSQSPESDKPVNATTEGVAGDPAGSDFHHDWIGAATVALTHAQASYANFRQSYRTKERERVDVLEVYCAGCRRPFDDVAEQPCEAKINNHHLIGGHPEERKKRKTYPTTGTPVPGPRINRRGVEAVVRGEA